jgi:hypothetical protein
MIEHFQGEAAAKNLVALEDLIDATWKNHEKAKYNDVSGRTRALEFLARLTGKLTDKVEVSGEAVGSLADLRELLSDSKKEPPPEEAQ